MCTQPNGFLLTLDTSRMCLMWPDFLLLLSLSLFFPDEKVWRWNFHILFSPLTFENQTVDVAMLSGPRCYQHVFNVLESDNIDNKQLSGSTSDPVLLHCGRKSKYLRTRDLSKTCRSAPILHHFIVIIQPCTHCPSNLKLLVYNVTFHITSIIIINTLWKACVCAHVNYALTHAGILALLEEQCGKIILFNYFTFLGSSTHFVISILFFISYRMIPAWIYNRTKQAAASNPLLTETMRTSLVDSTLFFLPSFF